MAPNLEVHSHFNNCAISYKENTVNVINNANCNADSGETISLASRRQERLRSNPDEEASPAVGTIARVTYNLDRYAKNAMLIIHNNCYGSSDKTADRVKSTFEKFRFEVDVLDNRNGEEILSALDKFFRRDFTEYGSAAVVLVCPMAANGAYKTKRKSFDDDDIIKYFEHGMVPTLEGKPKIFISEGDKPNFSKKVNTTGRDFVHLRLQKRKKPSRKSGLIQPYYLREFCKKIEQFADTKNFLEITDLLRKANVSYVGDRNSAQSVYGVMVSLSKELWLWKTE